MFFYRKNDFFKITFFLLLSIFIYILSLIQNSIYPVLIFTLMLCLYNLFLSRKSLNLSLFWLFISLFPWDYLLVKISGATFLYVYKHEYMADILFSLCIFCTFMLTVNNKNEHYHTGNKLEILTGNYIYYIYIILSFLITVYIKGESIISSDKSYSTYQENLNSGNGLTEYVLMIFIACLFFKKNTKMKFFFYAIISFYILKMVLLGFRVQAIIAIIIMSYLFFNERIKIKYNLLLCLLGLFSTLIYGFIKEGITISEQTISLELLLDTRYGYVQSHQQGVLSSSTVILSYENTDIPYILRWPAMFIVSILPRYFVGDLLPSMYPSTYVSRFEYIPGGGLFTSQIQFALGYIGLIFFSFIISYLFRKDLKQEKASIFTIIITTLLCFFPRWVSYDFFNYGIRSCVIVLLLVYFGKVLSKIKYHSKIM